jgi:hypothetical protein
MTGWNLENIDFSMGGLFDFARESQARQSVQRTKDAFKAYLRVPEKERLTFIVKNLKKISSSGQLEEIMIDFYTMLHFPTISYDLGLWVGLFGWCDRNRLLAAGDPLPPELGNKFMIYRGQDINRKPGISWSLSKDKAEWFAYERHKNLLGSKAGDVGVIEMEVTVGDILYYYNGREEQEVLIDPILITG